jgi:hypothetical protein
MPETAASSASVAGAATSRSTIPLSMTALKTTSEMLAEFSQ